MSINSVEGFYIHNIAIAIAVRVFHRTCVVPKGTKSPHHFNESEIMLSAIPIVGWLIQAALILSSSIVFYVVWVYFGNGEHFFDEYLPEQFIHVSFWRIFGLFTCMDIINLFLPKFVSSTSNSSGK